MMKPCNKRNIVMTAIGFSLLLTGNLLTLTVSCCHGQSLPQLQLEATDSFKVSNDDSEPGREPSYVDVNVLTKRVAQNETKIEQLDERLKSIEAAREIVGKQIETVASSACVLVAPPAMELHQPLPTPILASLPAASADVFENGNFCQSFYATSSSTEILPLPGALSAATFLEIEPPVATSQLTRRPAAGWSRTRSITTARPSISTGSLPSRLTRERSIQRNRTNHSQHRSTFSACRIVNGRRSCN